MLMLKRSVRMLFRPRLLLLCALLGLYLLLFNINPTDTGPRSWRDWVHLQRVRKGHPVCDEPVSALDTTFKSFQSGDGAWKIAQERLPLGYCGVSQPQCRRETNMYKWYTTGGVPLPEMEADATASLLTGKRLLFIGDDNVRSLFSALRCAFMKAADHYAYVVDDDHFVVDGCVPTMFEYAHTHHLVQPSVMSDDDTLIFPDNHLTLDVQLKKELGRLWAMDVVVIGTGGEWVNKRVWGGTSSKVMENPPLDEAAVAKHFRKHLSMLMNSIEDENTNLVVLLTVPTVHTSCTHVDEPHTEAVPLPIRIDTLNNAIKTFYRSYDGTKNSFPRILNITYASQFRADALITHHGEPCSEWCQESVPLQWADLFSSLLHSETAHPSLRHRSRSVKL